MYVYAENVFWGTGYTEDKLAAYQTLYVCLETVAKLMALIAPFYADKLYMDLIATTGRDHVASVHLADFPVCDETVIDKRIGNPHGVSTESIFYGVGAAQENKYYR